MVECNVPTSMQHQNLAGNTCSQGQRCKQAFARLEHQLHGKDRACLQPAYSACGDSSQVHMLLHGCYHKWVLTLHLTLPYFDCNSWKKPYLHSSQECGHVTIQL